MTRDTSVMTDADSGNTSRLADILRDLGLSQAQLATELEQAPNAVSRWVGGVEPRRTNKAEILAVLRDHGWAGTSTDIWPVDELDYESSCTRGH